MPDISRLCIHQVTLHDQWNFRQSVEGLARHEVHSTAVWRDKLQEIEISEPRKILQDNGMAVASICAGMLQNSADDNRRLLEDAVGIGAQSVVMISGGLNETKDTESARRSVPRFHRNPSP